MRLGDVNDVMPGSNGQRILSDFWKKAVSGDLNIEETSGFLSLGEARPVGIYEMRRALLGQMEQSA